MAKTLVAKKRKVAPKKAAKPEETKIVLAGTYKAGQLAWIGRHGLYNYPVKEDDGFDADAMGAVGELWLYADAKGTRHCHAAEYVGKVTREEWLKDNPTYAKLGKPTYKAYYVFKAKKQEYGTRFDAPHVIARVADFGGRSGKVKKAIKAYEASGDFGILADYLPQDLAQLPKGQLRVCEPLLQMDFMKMVEPNTHEIFPFPAPQTGKFTFIDLFAGIGGIRLGFQQNGGKCVFSSEWDKDAAKTYYYNFGERPFGDIQQIDPTSIPDFDVLLAGFPCQPFSIIGDKEGFNHETQGTLFFNIEKNAA